MCPSGQAMLLIDNGHTIQPRVRISFPETWLWKNVTIG